MTPHERTQHTSSFTQRNKSESSEVSESRCQFAGNTKDGRVKQYKRNLKDIPQKTF